MMFLSIDWVHRSRKRLKLDHNIHEDPAITELTAGDTSVKYILRYNVTNGNEGTNAFSSKVFSYLLYQICHMGNCL